MTAKQVSREHQLRALHWSAMRLPVFFRAENCVLATALAAALFACQPAPAVDLDGDGRADLLLRDRSDDNQKLVLVLSTPGGMTRGRLRLAVGLPPLDVRSGDFNADGRDDILSRNLETGEVRIRLMDGIQPIAQGMVEDITASPSSRLEEVADFDGDGSDDLLFHDSSTRTWSIYFMRGLRTYALRSGDLAFARSAALQLVAARDFDGDGRADLLFRNTTTLKWVMHRLDGLESRGAEAVPDLPVDPSWRLVAAEDLNRDGRTDLQFRDLDSGAWEVRFMDGVTATNSSGPAWLLDEVAWRPQAVADFNGDGHLDVLLQRADTGALWVEFMMQRWHLAGSGPVAIDPAATKSLRLAEAADVDGDGASEILVADGNDAWKVLNVQDPLQPVLQTLDLSSPLTLSLACTPPRYASPGRGSVPAGTPAQAAFLTWSTANTRQNGETLCRHEIAGYRIEASRDGSDVTRNIVIQDPGRNARLISALTPGTWSFRIATVDTAGVAGEFSEPLSKTID